MRIINLVKYSNRKLYAKSGEVSEKGTYVNLTEINDFIKAGYSFKVTEEKTGNDITNSVLRNVLLNKNVKLSDDFLHTLIKG